MLRITRYEEHLRLAAPYQTAGDKTAQADLHVTRGGPDLLACRLR